MAAKKGKPLTLHEVTSRAGKASAKKRLATLTKAERSQIGRRLALAKEVAWQEAEIAQAIALRQAGETLEAIAKVVGKSVSGVSRKLKEKGIAKTAKTGGKRNE